MALIYIVEDDESIREIETIALKKAVITSSVHLKTQRNFTRSWMSSYRTSYCLT